MKEEKKQENFFKKHKEEILFGGMSVIAVGTLLAFCDKQRVKTIFNNNEKLFNRRSANPSLCVQKTNVVIQSAEETLLKEVSVREHLRNLPRGYSPSVEKQIEAARKNILLGENMTLVCEHKRVCAT